MTLQPTITLLDSGLSVRHGAAHGARFVDLRSFIGRDPVVDEYGHGTECCSFLLSRLSEWASSEETQQVPLLIGQIIDARGTGTPEALCSAVRWAVGLGSDILVVPSGQKTSDPGVANAIRNALSQGSLVIAPVGNPFRGQTGALYPAAYDGVVGVGAEEYSESYRSWISPPAVVISNKGRMVRSVEGRWREASGTSFACMSAAALAWRFLLQDRGRNRTKGRDQLVAHLAAWSADGRRPGVWFQMSRSALNRQKRVLR